MGRAGRARKTDRIKTIRDRLLNQLVLNAFEMSLRNMDDVSRARSGFRPKCIYGYASSVALLAAHARERGYRLQSPELRVVCTTGEPLYPHQRALIGEVVRCTRRERIRQPRHRLHRARNLPRARCC